MKITIVIIIGITLATGLYFFFLSIMSRKLPDLGLENGKLLACPATPNCVCSEYPNSTGDVSPLKFTVAPDEAWERIKQVVLTMGGNIVKQQQGYLRATFTSRLFRYIDDLELRLDAKQQLIHVRSASRVGHSDFGVNKKRIDRIRAQFNPAGS
jgi:uncharacterized protein (DUF1499 family)